MAREYDWALFEKAVEITASALRGTMGGEKSQPPRYAGDLFREIWTALKDVSNELPDRGKAGF
jgi:hypothetical protein